MGWWGKPFYSNSLKDVRHAIEQDVNCTVVSLKLGYAICVVTQKDIDAREWLRDKPELLNLIIIALWRKQKGHLMIKQVSETMGPCERDIPLKYVNALCKETLNSQFACEWRANVCKWHRWRKQQNALARSFKCGDKFFVYGDLFEYYGTSRKKEKFEAVEIHTGKIYSIRNLQISMVA